jgi:DNA-binding NarL/FixJ family response regulator
MTRILIADDQARVRLAISILLEQEKYLEMCGEASDTDMLQQSITQAAPDLVLLDWELPGHAQEWRFPLQRADGTRVPVIAMSSQPETVTAALAAGAAAFICKGDPPEVVLTTIYRVTGLGPVPANPPTA